MTKLYEGYLDEVSFIVENSDNQEVNTITKEEMEEIAESMVKDIALNEHLNIVIADLINNVIIAKRDSQ